jgi:hypothetical protein
MGSDQQKPTAIKQDENLVLVFILVCLMMMCLEQKFHAVNNTVRTLQNFSCIVKLVRVTE